MKKIILLILLLLSGLSPVSAQQHYTRADSLRGSLRPARTGYDVLHYNLSVAIYPDKKYISGKNCIRFRVEDTLSVMQLDLFANMQIDSIRFHGQMLPYRREYNAVFITFPHLLQGGRVDSLDFFYSGHPVIAKKPPWDGGFIFTKDKNGKDWISVAVQGIGASLWMPCKDTQSDKPDDGVALHVNAPKGLMDVSNGRFVGKKVLPRGRVIWSWRVTYPIDNYEIAVNIGDYVHFSDHFKKLPLNYYVLSYHLKKAKKEFQEVKPMLQCFSKHFGPYPFPRDGYKLVETPYLGMEDQSAVAYGNGYQKGYAGRDLSKTGVGLKWDFIIIHESAHEWFGNSITAADIADMWIHESFTSYAESVYIECRWGKKEAQTYLRGLRKTMVKNKKPIIGDYGVNSPGSEDMYYKGANMLNTLRYIVDDDARWWKLLKNFALTFRGRITNTEEVVHFFATHIHKKMHVKAFFDQYLRFPKLPELRFKHYKGRVAYRWEAKAVGFNMPVDLKIDGKKVRVHPSKYWQELDHGIRMHDIKVDTKHFYITVKKYR